MKKLVSLMLCMIMMLSTVPSLATAASASTAVAVYKSSVGFDSKAENGTWGTGGVWSATLINTANENPYSQITDVDDKGNFKDSTYFAYVNATEIAPVVGIDPAKNYYQTVGGAKTFTAPQSGKITISYAEITHPSFDGQTGAVVKFAWNQGIKFRVTKQAAGSTASGQLYPTTNDDFVASANGAGTLQMAASDITTETYISKGDKIHFEVMRNVADNPWQGVYCDPIITYTEVHAEPESRNVFKSSEYFAANSGNGTWDGGVWSATVVDTSANIYTPFTSVKKESRNAWWGQVKVTNTEIVPYIGDGDNAPANNHIGAAKTFTAPKDGYVQISYAEVDRPNKRDDDLHKKLGVSVFQINRQMSFRVRTERDGETVKIYPKNEDYINSLTDWSTVMMIEAENPTNALWLNKGDKLHFEVKKTVAANEDNYNGVYCDPVVEYLTESSEPQRMVYRSSARFSTATGDGTWDDGVWSAQILNPETDEYSNMTQSGAAGGMGKDTEDANAYMYSGGNNHMVSAYRITPPNNQYSDEQKRLWYVSKTFTAPRDGKITITCGDDKIIGRDGSKPKIRIRKKAQNGSVQTLMTETTLLYGDYNIAYEPKHLYVNAGDEIHFEAARTQQSGSTWIHLYWDPIVTYVDDTLFVPSDDGRMTYTAAENFSTATGDGAWDGGIWSAQILNPQSNEYLNINGVNLQKFSDKAESVNNPAAYMYVSDNNMSVGAYRITPPTNGDWSEAETRLWYTSKTFTAPKAGSVTLTCGEDKLTTDDGSAPKARIRKLGRDGTVEVLLDEVSLSYGGENYAHAPIITKVLPGDEIHFEVVRTRESGNHHPSIYWNPRVSYAESAQTVNPQSATQYPTDIPVYFNGIRSGLKNKPYLDNGIWMVPFKECMSIFGVDVAYDSTSGAYKGKLGGIEISVKPNSDQEIYDLVDIELDRTSVGVTDDVMVQIDLLDKIYGAAVTVKPDEIRINLEVQNAWANDITPEYVDSAVAGLSGTEMLNMNGLNSLYVNGNMSKEKKTLSNDKFSTVYELKSKKRTNMTWDSQGGMNLSGAIAENDVLIMSFWARCISSDYYNGKASFDIMHRRDDGGDSLCGSHIEVGSDWQRFVIAYKNRGDAVASGESSFGIQTGYAVQTFQLAEVKIINYTSQVDETKVKLDSAAYITNEGSTYRTKATDYYGREDNALWRQEALKRIEKNRVRDITVKVVDESGNPIKNAKVNANMTRSEFNWGAQANYDEMHEAYGHETLYEKVKQHFNTISDGTYFKYYGYEKDKIAETIMYAYENNMRSRSHCYMWDGLGFLQPEARPDEWITADTTVDEMTELYTWHASRSLYNFGEHIDEIDVLNEPLCNNYFQTKYGRDFVAKVYNRVRLMAPNSRLYINEGWLDGMESEWHHVRIFKDEILRDYLALGMDIDAIGFEGHYVNPTYPQLAYDQVSYVTDGIDYASVTEYDYSASDLENQEKLELEADFLRDMIISTYSHPKMVGFNIWTFYRWNTSTFYDYNWKEKPALQGWRELVEDEWFTQASDETDASGEARMRGHRGEYDITVDIDGFIAKTTLVVSDTGENTVIAVVKNGEMVFDSSEPVKKREIKHSYPAIPLYDNEAAAQKYKSVYAVAQDTLSVTDTTISGTPQVRLASLCDSARTGSVLYAIYNGENLLAVYVKDDITVPANDEVYVSFENIEISVPSNARITQRVFMFDDELIPQLSMNYDKTLKK